MSRPAVIIVLAATILSFLIAAMVSMNGSGGLRGAVTLSGVYAVPEPDGYPVVCFINKASGAMDCLARHEISAHPKI